ncbi:hypothetical protein BJY52DRAFT_1205548 [Lactarius psammicola]|nr:hypothetical protein BJY52DRAFT_1205548 [Lactarius psammicola]
MDHNSWLASSLSYVYVDPPNSNLLCCICRMPFVEPTTSRTCAHSFCHDCIRPALQASPHCPIDRSPLSPQDMTPSNPIMVDELIVECLNRSNGCEFTCQRHLLAAHLKDDCLFVEHAAHGCSWTGPRSALQDTHTPHCPYAALQGFFRISDARSAALESENVLLRARLDAAEGMLAVMRHELQAIKGALGPWSPDADSSPPSPYSQAALSSPQPPPAAAHHLPFSPPTSASVPPYSWRGHYDPPADVMAHLPPHPPTTALSDDPSTAAATSLEPRAVGITPADLAAYFPPPASDASMNSPPSPTTTTSSTTSGGAGRSLSATLTALRSALQTHDARARMSANAHAAELGAIRQVVAGLRMQLHAVLMELSNASSNGGHVTGTDGWTPKLPAAARFFLPGLVPPLPPPAVSITKL